MEETTKLQMTSDASIELFNLTTQFIDQPIFEEQDEDGSIEMKQEEINEF